MLKLTSQSHDILWQSLEEVIRSKGGALMIGVTFKKESPEKAHSLHVLSEEAVSINSCLQNPKQAPIRQPPPAP